MTTYVARFQASIEIVVEVEAEDGDVDEASDKAWQRANKYAQTVYGDGQGVKALVSLDGVGAYEVVKGRLG